MKMIRNLDNNTSLNLRVSHNKEIASNSLLNRNAAQAFFASSSSLNSRASLLINDSINSTNSLMSKGWASAVKNAASVDAPTSYLNDRSDLTNKISDQSKRVAYHSPARLLIADDNPLIRVSLANLLNKWGINFSLCNDGLQAWNKLQEESFDMLIIDLQMPNMNGYEVIQQLRSSKKNTNSTIPIVVISETDNTTMADQIKQIEVDVHILKPFKPGALFNAITSLKCIPTYQKVRFFSDHLDSSTLEQLYGNDQEHIKIIFSLFLKSTPEILLEMKTALKDENISDLERLLHKLKPSFTMVGLTKMTVYTQEFETKIKQLKTVALLEAAFEKYEQKVEQAIDLITIEQQKTA